MKPYLQLIRVPNLLFIILTQFLMRQAVIVPILQVHGFEVSSPGRSLLLLIIATVFIAAGGYVLNDCFDIKIDAINRPDKLIISRLIDKRSAMRFYQTLTAMGIICGLFLSYTSKSFTLAFIFIVIPGLLWFYSANYKRQFLIGNLVISFNTALSLLIVAITEISLLQTEYGQLIFETSIPKMIYGWIGGFAVFAFLLNWIREIIKDMEDETGDREMECRTMPIKWGIGNSKIFLYCLITLTISTLFFVNKFYIPFEGTLTVRYISVGLVLPLIILICLTVRSKSPADYHQASTFTKFIMLTGVLYSVIFYYLQAKTYGINMFGLFIVQ